MDSTRCHGTPGGARPFCQGGERGTASQTGTQPGHRQRTGTGLPHPRRLQEKLDEALAGLETSTRRAKVRALRVLHVSSARMSYSPKTLRPRCTALDLDLLWEAQPVSKAGGGPAAPLQGMARCVSAHSASHLQDSQDADFLRR